MAFANEVEMGDNPKTPIVFLKGKGIYLRPMEQGDAESFTRWINDPETRQTIAMYRPLSLQAEHKWIDTQGEDPNEFRFAIVVGESDRLIGATGLRNVDWKNRNGCFGITIGDASQRGRGYGTEATRLVLRYCFETLNLHRVYLDVYEFNAAGIKAYEKAGFVKEGVLRQHQFVSYRFWDVYHYGILAHEFQAHSGL